MQNYDLTIETTEKLLASSPANPEVYKQYIASRKRDELPQDEINTLPADEQERVGWSVFHSDETGLFLFEYHVKGFLKEAARTVTGKLVTALVSKIDRFLFVVPRRLYMGNGAGIIQKPHGVEERPIRAMTMQGPRVSLKRSDYVDIGTKLSCRVTVLKDSEFRAAKNKELEPSDPFDMHDLLSSWLDYGQYMGLGEWRTGGYGRFTYTLRAQQGEAK